MRQAPAWTPEAIRYGRDAESGAEVEQLTSDAVTSNNISCEQRYASADGSRIAIKRTPFGGPMELWVCDMRSLRLCRVAVGEPVGANAARNAVYYIARGDNVARLMRLDLTDLTTREMLGFDGPPPSVVAVSPDERWLVGGPFAVKDNVFSLRRSDLASVRGETLCEIEDMFNPHIQFEPSEGRRIAVQINRGGRTDKKTGRMTLAGALGATLCVIDVESGEVSPLPVGRPDTPGITGHACWAGPSGRLLFTAGVLNVSLSAYVTYREPRENERDKPRAAIYSVAPGDATARVVAEGFLYNHLAASEDGRFFIADDHATGRVYVGSVATGRALGLCDSRTRQGACQHSHVHAYMTPDGRFVVFNSIVTGVAQVYAARIPEGFLDGVLELGE